MFRPRSFGEGEPFQQRLVPVVFDVIGHQRQLSPVSETSICIDECVVPEGYAEVAQIVLFIWKS